MLLAGVDEVGRGCLAGDVFAAAVVYPEGFDYAACDSKTLSETKRKQSYEKLIQGSIYSVARASVAEIDEHNILQASLLAMKRAIEALNLPLDEVLVDGTHLPDIDYKMRAIIGGDGKIKQIAAASIIAKVQRDLYMQECAKRYPVYGFEQHKGYGTRLHLEKIQQIGICDIHRLSFASIKNVYSS